MLGSLKRDSVLVEHRLMIRDKKIAGIICGERFESQWGSPEREVDFF